MTAEQALRYLLGELQAQGDRDRVEAAVLLIAPMAKALGLEPMNDHFERKAFMYSLKQELLGKNAYQHAA